MIRLWNSTETNFKGNLWVLNETTSANVTEITNGEFSLDLEYPLKDSKDLSKYFLRGNLITCPVMDDRPEQQFRIRKVDKTSNGVIIYAQAKLIADLSNNYIRPITLTGLTRKQAIQAVLNAALEPHHFVVGNLDTNTTNNVIVNIQEGTVLNALIGSENSILSEYGGEFIINNNEFNIVNSRGANNNFTIAYAKNISSIKESIDDTDLATVLIPKSGDYRLPEYMIESPNVIAYEKRYFKDIEFNLKIWDGNNERGEDELTIAQAYEIMRNTCNKMFLVDRVDQINFNYSIDLVSLSKTEEYKEYSILEISNNGDVVKVKHKLLNLDLVGRINKTIYNALLDKYSKVEIGFTKQDITDIIKTTIKQIQFTKDEILLNVKDTAKHITAEFKIADNAIKQSVTDLDNKTSSALTLQAKKIDAVVQSGDTEGSWELSESAFKVAFSGASDGYTIIDANGITIYDGKFKIKKGSNTVFYVSTSGRCTADGGFRVDDNGTSTELNSDGLVITNTNGYEGTLQAYNRNNTLYTPSDFHIGEDLFVAGHTVIDDWCDIETDLWVGGSLDVVGEKNCLQNTKNYSSRRINAYETAEYWFGDVGSGTIKDGECIIYIDDIFSECVNTDIEYQVFTQCYNGSINRIDRFTTYFIIHGEDDTEFVWELKAKRKGYENNRLECKLDKNDTSTYELESILLKNKDTNLEGILLEEVL